MMDTPYGVTIGSKGPLLNASTIDDMKTLGLSWLRFQVPWSQVETSKGVYDWHLWDDAVQKCNAAGLSLCLTIKGPPTFWITNGLPDPQGTALIAKAIVERYGGQSGSGSIQALELGNEDYDVGAGTSPTPLAETLKAAYPVIKSIQPHLPVVMPSILQRNAQHIKLFMDGIWEQAAGHFDVANFHFYTCIPGNGHFDPTDGTIPNVPSLAQYITILQQSHEQAGHPNFPTWCTEFGFATTPQFGRPSKCVTDEQTAWGFLKYGYEQFRGSGFVEKAFIFTLGYASPPDGMSLVQSGKQTAAYAGLKAYTQQFPQWSGENSGGGGSGGNTGPTPEQIAQAVADVQATQQQLQTISARLADALALLQPSV